MSVGIAAEVRGPNVLGGTNPFEMMKSMFELRNMQAEYQGKMQLGQIAATSQNFDDFQSKAQQNPFYSFMLPQITEMARQKQLAVETSGKQYSNDAQRLQDAYNMGGDQPSTLRMISDAEAQAAPRNKYLFAHAYDSLSGPMSDDEFQMKKLGQQITFSGRSPSQAYGAQGWLDPQTARVQGVAGGPEQLLQVGGRPTTASPWSTGRLAGGLGGTGGQDTGGAITLSPTPFTGAQIEDAKVLADRQSTLGAEVQNGNRVMQTIEKAQQLLQKFDTSSLSDKRSVVAGLAQAVGFSPDAVTQIAGGDLGSMQEFTKYLYTIASQRLSGSMPPGGRLNLPETEAWLGANPTINMQKKSVNDIFQNIQRAHIANIIQQRILGRYRTEHATDRGAAAAYPDYWQGIQQRKGLNDPQYDAPSAPGNHVNPKIIMDLLANPTAENKRLVNQKYNNGKPGFAERFTEDQ